jgi:hypothetical protein
MFSSVAKVRQIDRKGGFPRACVGTEPPGAPLRSVNLLEAQGRSAIQVTHPTNFV